MRKFFAWTLTWGAIAGLLLQAPGAAFAQPAPSAHRRLPLLSRCLLLPSMNAVP